ncbi:MAG: GGDEF domain-containing protein [Solobacterium sp.]|nr:GGDEF domain-containing protein [Solobacterium sp.]
MVSCRTAESTKKKTFRHLITILGISILGFGFLLRLFITFHGVQDNYKISLDDRVKGQILYPDGTGESFQGTSFPAVHQGSRLILTIEDPPELTDSLGADFCFFASNSLVEVSLEDTVIYTQDRTKIEQGLMPCKQFYVISLPPDYPHHKITADITAVDRSSFTEMSLWLSPGGHAAKNLLAGSESSFLLLITMAIVSGFAMILMSVVIVLTKRKNPTVFLAWFCFFLVFWNLGAQGFLFLLSDSFIASQGEYIALYLACIPLSLYMVFTIRSKVIKTIMKGFAAFFILFFLYVSYLNFSSIQASYNTTLMVLHAAIALLILAYFLSLFLDRHRHRSMSEAIADYGFRICVAIGALEFIRFNIVNNFGAPLEFMRDSFGPIAIAELVTSMILSAGFSYLTELLETVEKEQLRKLAYQDNLTGIPNRSACYLGLDDLEKNHVKDYTMLFLDLNFLKKANDTYGHEVGDRMLILTADCLKKAFEECGFYGRWGGDEFLACVPGTSEKGDQALAVFRKEAERINRTEKDLPYGLSIAVGRADSSEASPLAPMDAVNIADDGMYQDKKRMKAERAD